MRNKLILIHFHTYGRSKSRTEKRHRLRELFLAGIELAVIELKVEIGIIGQFHFFLSRFTCGETPRKHFLRHSVKAT